MDDAMAHRMFGFIFGVCGLLAVLTSLTVSVYMSEMGPTAPLVWVTAVFGLAAMAGGLGLYRQMALARRAMMLEAGLLVCGAVIGALASVLSEPMKAIVLLTGIMPAVAAIAMLFELERSQRRTG